MVHDGEHWLAVMVQVMSGIIGVISIHAPHRNEEKKMRHVVWEMEDVLVEYDEVQCVLGGDWNRDIRTHKFMREWCVEMGCQVMTTQGSEVDKPKDFCMVRGVGLWEKVNGRTQLQIIPQWCGKWR